MPTASYAPFLRFKQSGEFERAKRHVSWRVSLEFGVGGWRMAEIKWGWGWDWGRSFCNFVNLIKFNSAQRKKRRRIGCGGKK